MTKTTTSLRTGKNTLADTAILSLADFERIRKNAVVLTKDEEKNNHKIYLEQRDLKEAQAKVNYFFYILYHFFIIQVYLY